MKKLIFLLAISAFVGFSSCKKDVVAKPQPVAAVPPPPVQKVDAAAPAPGVTYDYQKAIMAKHTTLKSN